MFLGIVFTLAPLLLLALIGAGVVALVRGKLTFPAVVHAYTAIVFGLCAILALVGGAFLLKAGLSEVFSRDFSYQNFSAQTGGYPPAGPYGGPPSVETQAKNDVATGITLLVIGVLLGAVHAFGRAAAARRNTMYAGAVERGFDTVMLVVATVVGLASAIMLLNDLLRRYVVTDAGRAAADLPHPGGPLAFVLTFLPLWAFFAARVWRALLGSPPRATAPPPAALGQPTPAP